jgi:hypothetical protein
MAGAAGIAGSPAHAATEVPVKPPSSPGGWAQIDDFAGATDGEKLANAMRYAAAQTFIPTLQFPARTFELGTQQYAVYNGMKLAGAGMSTGPKNNEHGDRLVSGKVMTSAGLDAKATFVVTGDVYGVTIAGVVFHGASGTQLMHTDTTGNLYSAQLDALTVYGFTLADRTAGSGRRAFSTSVPTTAVAHTSWTSTGCRSRSSAVSTSPPIRTSGRSASGGAATSTSTAVCTRDSKTPIRRSAPPSGSRAVTRRSARRGSPMPCARRSRASTE